MGETLHYEGGIRQFVEHIHKTRGVTPLSEEVIYVNGMEGDTFAEIALQYNDTYNDLILSFANNIHTPDGGTHETGFKNALTKVINNYGKKFGYLKDDDKLLGDDVREGLTAIVSVKLTNCEFEGQTKGRLGNPEVRPFVDKKPQRKQESLQEENLLLNHLHCLASLQIAQREMLHSPRSISSREILRVALQRKAEIENIRLYFLCGEKCST